MPNSVTEARGSGRAKLILFGEHAVVYGKPAIAAGLPRGARAIAREAAAESSTITVRSDLDDKVEGPVVPDSEGAPIAASYAALLRQFDAPRPVDLDVTLEVPIGVGLGSSAALAVAAARALGEFFEQPGLVDDAVRASEEVFHGNPSGIDQMAATEGGLIFFSRSDKIEAAPIEAPALTLAVCQAGPPASTAQMVDKVAARKRREPALVDYLNLLIGDTARTAAEALREGDWRRVGELMDINHGALCALGVSTAALDAACHAAREAGALGAKITGAGGGGCIFALTPGGADDVLAAWSDSGWQGFEVTIGG